MSENGGNGYARSEDGPFTWPRLVASEIVGQDDAYLVSLIPCDGDEPERLSVVKLSNISRAAT